MKQLVALLFIVSMVVANPKGCYDHFPIEGEVDSSIETAVFVLIDETTHFNDMLKEQLISNSLNSLKQGTYIYLAKFSAFVSGHYNQKLFDFYLDKPLTDEQKFYTKKSQIQKIDKCIKDQFLFVRHTVQKTISEAFLPMDSDIPKSDILFALEDFSTKVISQVNAKKKIVILASDMLENSSISTFYSRGTARLIDPKKELSVVENEKLFGDFDNSDIYVIGSGLVNGGGSNSYRDPRILRSLSQFWEEYFLKSNGKLQEIGQPSLTKLIPFY
jgi:hypothetical protein